MLCLDYYHSNVLQIVTKRICTPFRCISNLANQCTILLGLEYLYLTYKLSVQTFDHIHERRVANSVMEVVNRYPEQYSTCDQQACGKLEGTHNLQVRMVRPVSTRHHIQSNQYRKVCYFLISCFGGNMESNSGSSLEEFFGVV